MCIDAKYFALNNGKKMVFCRKITVKKRKALMRAHKKNFLETVNSLPTVSESYMKYATPKQKRIFKECAKPENQPPCKRGQVRSNLCRLWCLYSKYKVEVQKLVKIRSSSWPNLFHDKVSLSRKNCVKFMFPIL